MRHGNASAGAAHGRFRRGHHGDSGKDPVPPPRKKFQTKLNLVIRCCFRQDPPAAGDDGVGGKYEHISLRRGNCYRFVPRHAQRIFAGQLTLQRFDVDPKIRTRWFFTYAA